MTAFTTKNQTKNQTKKQVQKHTHTNLIKITKQKIHHQGFTLIELIVVIIILGVMSMGIAGFITLSTQTYLNVSERDELLSSARFAVERLNREIRNAVPNSIRVKNDNSKQCIEFVAIEASTTYIDIPVKPESANANISVIRFKDKNGNPYECNTCADQVIIYPLSADEVYATHTDTTGKVFNIANFSPPEPEEDEWTLPIANGAVLFDDDSPTERLYIANQQISYCIGNNKIYRYKNVIGGEQELLPSPSDSSVPKTYLMAEHVAPIDVNYLPFTFVPATLTRNAMVQVKLHFIRNDEDYVFNNDIHINNIP